MPLGNHLDGGESMILGSGGFSGAGGGASGMGGGTATSTVVTSWPTFTGDCQANWGRTLSASNGGGDRSEVDFLLDDRRPGQQLADTFLMLTFLPEQINLPLAVRRNGGDQEIDLHYAIGNEMYTGWGAEGQIQGTVTVTQYDAAAGVAEFVFSGVTLIGEESGIAGTLRCGINGVWKVVGFTRLARGTRCGTDSQCGGNYSGLVCGNTSFVCEPGCHRDVSCPFGQTCNATVGQCK